MTVGGWPMFLRLPLRAFASLVGKAFASLRERRSTALPGCLSALESVQTELFELKNRHDEEMVAK